MGPQDALEKLFGGETAGPFFRPNRGSHATLGAIKVEGEKASAGFRGRIIEKLNWVIQGINFRLEAFCCTVPDLLTHSWLIIRQTSLRARIGGEARDHFQLTMG